jgi:hypothetical protein
VATRPGPQQSATCFGLAEQASSPRGGVAIAGGPADEARRGGRHQHSQSVGSIPGYAQGGGTHHAGLTMVGCGKGLRARVLSGGEGVSVGGDNSRELMRVGKREGSAMVHSNLDGRARRG